MIKFSEFVSESNINEGLWSWFKNKLDRSMSIYDEHDVGESVTIGKSESAKVIPDVLYKKTKLGKETIELLDYKSGKTINMPWSEWRKLEAKHNRDWVGNPNGIFFDTRDIMKSITKGETKVTLAKGEKIDFEYETNVKLIKDTVVTVQKQKLDKKHADTEIMAKDANGKELVFAFWNIKV